METLRKIIAVILTIMCAVSCFENIYWSGELIRESTPTEYKDAY